VAPTDQEASADREASAGLAAGRGA
jgi:hypothetical protein